MTDRPIRVVRLITRLNVSGPALQTILLTAELRRIGYETHLIAGYTPAHRDNMLAVAERYGVEVIRVDDLTRSLNPLRFLRAVWSLYATLRRLQPDIVHTHTTTAGFVGRVVARLAGVRVVVHTLHVHPFKGYYNTFRTRVFGWVEWIGARLSDSIITLSESLRQELAETYRIAPKRALTVLPLGFDLAQFAQMPRHESTFRQAHNIPLDVPLVGFVGRLIPVKDPARFVAIVTALRQRVPTVHAVMIGDGTLRPELEAQARALGIADHITFTGWVEDMPAAYSDIDALLLTSHNEGTPVPIIEALTAGCAVVASHVGGVADLLDNGAFGTLIEGEAIEAYVEALAGLLASPPNPTPAREAMVRRYGIERLAQDLDSLYRGLLARKPLAR